MRIGLTYDLASEHREALADEEKLAELDRDDTVDALEASIAKLGHDVVRIGGAKALVGRLAAGERWDLVFNIAEGLNGAARESQVPGLLDVYGIPYTFSDPLVLAVTLEKDLAKHVVRAAGVPTPDFAVIRREADLQDVDLPYPLFAKPIAEGTSKGIGADSIVRDAAALTATATKLLNRFAQPVLVERYLSGREVTVGILGTGHEAEVLGTLEVTIYGPGDRGVYSYDNKKKWEDRVSYAWVRASEDEAIAAAEAVALDAWRALHCRDGGRVDVRFDDAGRPMFLEVNPLPGLSPIDSDLAILIGQMGIPYDALIARIVQSASRRVGK